MTVTINGIKVEGTPEEISELLKLQDNRNHLDYQRINSPDIPDRTYTYPYWWYAPPYDWSRDTGVEYLKYQPTCTSTTTAQATSDGISMTTSGENK